MRQAELGRWERVDISLESFGFARAAANICLRVNNPSSDLFHIWPVCESSCQIVSTLVTRLSLTFDIHCQFCVCSSPLRTSFYTFFIASFFHRCRRRWLLYIFHGILMRAKAHRQTLLSLKPHKLSSKGRKGTERDGQGALQLFGAKNVQSSVRLLIVQLYPEILRCGFKDIRIKYMCEYASS